MSEIDRSEWLNAGWCDRCETDVKDAGVHASWHERQDSGEPPPVFHGTGAAAPMAANMMARLMASGMSTREAAQAMRQSTGDGDASEETT